MKKNIILSFFILLPTVSLAASNGVKDYLISIRGLMNPIIAVMAGLSVVYFFWGVSQFILKAGEPEARAEGRKKMLWGIVAIFVIFCIVGIISWLGEMVGTTGGSNINPPADCAPEGGDFTNCPPGMGGN